MSKLAIKGGQATVSNEYRTFKHPQISGQIASSMNSELFREEMASFDGPIIGRLQQRLCDWLGVSHALLTNSGTSALFSLYYGIGLKPGDEVIVSGYTFFASAMPLFILGCRPILADTLENGNVDPDDIIRKINKKTKAIAITHLWGIPCDMDEIMSLANKYGLPLLEDTSHAHGTLYSGKKSGTFGLGSAWSMGAKKLITGGQGGALFTNDSLVYQRAILIGQANNKRIDAINLPAFEPYSTTGTGFNLRMHPFAAALILEQIESFESQLRDRREVAHFMRKRLSSSPVLALPRVPDNSEPSWYAFPILYDQRKLSISRDAFVRAVVAEGAVEVDIPRSTCPLNEFAAFRPGNIELNWGRENNPVNLNLPRAEEYHRKIIKLPTWYGPHRFEYAEAYMQSIEKVCKNLNELE